MRLKYYLDIVFLLSPFADIGAHVGACLSFCGSGYLGDTGPGFRNQVPALPYASKDLIVRALGPRPLKDPIIRSLEA